MEADISFLSYPGALSIHNPSKAQTHSLYFAWNDSKSCLIPLNLTAKGGTMKILLNSFYQPSMAKTSMI